ncbi:MAG: DNA-binding protein, partial [Sedimentisphaerales bacterium]|nr:DNA-binding protein [Sedimentisphaerales bacterium]
MQEESKGEIIIYRTSGGTASLEVKLQDETVWLSQSQMADLFDKDKRTVSEHIRNIFKEKELSEYSVVR